MNSRLVPNSAWISSSVFSTEHCTDTSSAETGSSHTSKSGRLASVRAMATRCFSPPLSWRGFRCR